MIFLIPGCTALVKQPPPLPDEYMQYCKYPVLLTDGKHATVEIWAITTATDLIKCAEMHGKLIEAVKRREELYK